MTLVKRVWTDEQGFAALGASWDSLLAHSAFSSPFMSASWHQTWWHHFREGMLHLVSWHETDGTLVGLVSLCSTTVDGEQHLVPLGDVEVADYLDVLALAGQEKLVYQALLDHLESPEAPPWDEVLLVNLPEATHTHTHLAKLAQAHGWWVQVTVEDVCPVIALPSTFDAYLKMLGKKQRHEVRRKMRRLFTRGGEVRRRVVGPGDDLEQAMDTFVYLHRRSHPEKEAFMTPQMEGFFRDIARLARQQGWLHLSFLEINDVPAATLFCFDYNRRRMVYNSGFDPEVCAPLTPGINLIVMEIEDAIGQGLTYLDFLQGAEEYKFRLRAQPTYVYRLRIRRDPRTRKVRPATVPPRSPTGKSLTTRMPTGKGDHARRSVFTPAAALTTRNTASRPVTSL